MTSLLILGIETSCDETATALYDSEKGLIGHKVFSQIDLHNQYGGVVPELASSHFLVQRIGFSHASEMCLTGRLYAPAVGELDPDLSVAGCLLRVLDLKVNHGSRRRRHC